MITSQLDRLVDYFAAHPELAPAGIVDVKVEHFAQGPSSGAEDVTRPGAECLRRYGAGHEMVVVEVDGSRSPYHRFSPWVTGRKAPSSPVNHQIAWKPEECAHCLLGRICPTCAGFHWQESGDSAYRTRYHCDAFRLEVLVSAELKALQLLKPSREDLTKLPSDELHKVQYQLDGIFQLMSVGV